VPEEPSEPEARAGEPLPARILDYWLGGDDHLPVDRAAAEYWLTIEPDAARVTRAGRAFLTRVVRHLVLGEGITQFLDIGSGLPSAGNTHQVALRADPSATVVYVDHDPAVQAQAKQLLAGVDQNAVRFLDADVQDPAGLLRGAAELIDFSRPVGVLMIGMLGHISDLEDALDVVKYVMARTAPGSFLAVCDSTAVHSDEVVAQASAAQFGDVAYLTREPAELEHFFEGLDWVEPGFVQAQLWRPDADTDPRPVHAHGGVGRRR
jgi:hypothetical protein